jgi:uracil-DNA glycosylase
MHRVVHRGHRRVVHNQLAACGVLHAACCTLITLAMMDDLARRIHACRACPRLVEWRETVARDRRAAFADEVYWGKPVAGFGDPEGRLMVLGLAPAAHGANRTGRMFTGDRSGDWLYRALHRAGFADRPESVSAGDGLTLIDCWVTSAVKCAPPANRPTADERDRCRGWLEAEIDRLRGLTAIVCLGGFAWTVAHGVLASRGLVTERPRPRFGHGASYPTAGPAVIGSYHPSQQNTFTGRLTEQMLDEVFAAARRHLAAG